MGARVNLRGNAEVCASGQPLRAIVQGNQVANDVRPTLPVGSMLVLHKVRMHGIRIKVAPRIMSVLDDTSGAVFFAPQPREVP
jgi:hypothetical protein